MKKYKKVDISEQALEGLIRQNAGIIEEGLVFVDHQKQAAGGRLDMLMVDSGNALVVAELKVVQDDGMLMQGLDYYEHVTARIETFARLYTKHSINLKQQVRLILVAPSFSQTLGSRAKWLDLPLSLFTYTSIQFEGEAEVVPIFAEHEIETSTAYQPGADTGIYDFPYHLDYITDQAVRAQVESIIADAPTWPFGAITVDPIKHSLSFKVNNKWFAYIHVRRKHFIVTTYDEEMAKDFPVKSDEDFTNVVDKMKASARWMAG